MGVDNVGGIHASNFGSNHDGHPGAWLAVYLFWTIDSGTRNRVGSRAKQAGNARSREAGCQSQVDFEAEEIVPLIEPFSR